MFQTADWAFWLHLQLVEDHQPEQKIRWVCCQPRRHWLRTCHTIDTSMIKKPLLGVTWVRIHLKCKMSWLKNKKQKGCTWKVCFEQLQSSLENATSTADWMFQDPDKLRTVSKPTCESHPFPLVESRLQEGSGHRLWPSQVHQNGGKVMLSDAGYPRAGNVELLEHHL